MLSEDDQTAGFVDVSISTFDANENEGGNEGGNGGEGEGVIFDVLNKENASAAPAAPASTIAPATAPATANVSTQKMNENDFGLLDESLNDTMDHSAAAAAATTTTTPSGGVGIGSTNASSSTTGVRSVPPQSLMATDTDSFDQTSTIRTNNTANNTTNNNYNNNDDHNINNNFNDNNDDGIDSSSYTPRSLTIEDLNIIQQLDEEYEQTLVEREIGWNARYISVRQNAGLSLWFMVLFLVVGTIFFDIKTTWTIGESLLFSVYTITTVGYGRHEFPREPGILFFISVYIFLGIATLTVMAAQLYQWVVLELTWARYEHDKQLFTKRHERNVQASNDIEGVNEHGPMMDLSASGEVKTKKSCAASTLDFAVVVINKVQNFVKEYPYGQIIVVMVPFWFLICLGALVVGSIEGWTFMESMYFSVVSLTTVGYGDYYPDTPATRWFCILWLPFSVFFVSLYLGSVAGFYIEMSDRNVRRIERKLRKRMHLFKTWQEREKEAARLRGLSGGFDVNIENNENLPSHIQTPPKRLDRRKGFDKVSSTSPDSPKSAKTPRTKNRRSEILANSGQVGIDQDGAEDGGTQTMKTMKDVITAIKMNLSSSRRSTVDDTSDMLESGTPVKNEALNVHSTSFYNTSRGIAKKPTFALRVVVQERLAQIIAHEVAGFQSGVTIKNNTLSVTIESLKQTCEKWYIPRRATKNFRSVAFETLYFVGERQLIVKGAEAVFELRPAEVQGLFGPVLAALGDSATMEAWLNRTQALAENELGNLENDTNFKLNLVDDRRIHQVTQNMTADPKRQRTVIGNAFNNS